MLTFAKLFIVALAVFMQTAMLSNFGAPGTSYFSTVFVGLMMFLACELFTQLLVRPVARVHEWASKRLDKETAGLVLVMSMLAGVSLAVAPVLLALNLSLPGAVNPKFNGLFLSLLGGFGSVFTKLLFSSLTNTPVLLLPWLFGKKSAG